MKRSIYRCVEVLLLMLGFIVIESCSALNERRGCSIVTISHEGHVFFGGNDDYHNRDSTYWVDPGGQSGYGAIYFGDPHNVQQGFNEKGLAYDANGLPRFPVSEHPGTEPVQGGHTNYPIAILRECATVAEVIAWVESHSWRDAMHDQLHFADASGDAVVISVGADGRVAYTRKPAGDSYLVSTNFNVANPKNGSYPCWRYDLTERLLPDLLESGNVTVDSVASVMEAVHVEEPANWTLYTLVADLTEGLIYVYFMFQYDAPIVLSIEEEVAREPSAVSVSSLFPEQTIIRANEALGELTRQQARCRMSGFFWLVVALLSVIGLFVFIPKGRRNPAYFLVTAILGPFGLLLAFFNNRVSGKVIESSWIHSIFQAGFGLASVALISTAGVSALLFVPILNDSSAAQLLMFLAAPFIFALLVFYGPVSAISRQTSYFRAILRLAPRVFHATNVSVAVLFPVLAPFVIWTVGKCGPEPPLILSLWSAAGLSCAASCVVLTFYNRILLWVGPAAWAESVTDVLSGSTAPIGHLRTRWWYTLTWLLAGVVILLAGSVFASVTISMISP